LVVIIAILTGKIGIFSAGVEGAASCGNVCKALGMDSTTLSKENCDFLESNSIETKYISGDFSDAKYGCCCLKEEPEAESEDE
ncbi:hypothetical protein ACFLUF_02875, partial [Chloroflexota bacterium]